MSQVSALVIIFDGVEEMEALAPVDCLRRAGVQVTLASSGREKAVTGRNRIVIEADTLLADTGASGHDLVVIPGGPGHASLLSENSVLDLLRKQNADGGWIGSICAGPVVLKEAGLLEGRQYTSFPATADVLDKRDPSRKVVRDQNLITAQGAGCSIEFALALVEALRGSDISRQIAESICYDSF